MTAVGTPTPAADLEPVAALGAGRSWRPSERHARFAWSVALFAIVLVVWAAGSAGDWWSEATIPDLGDVWAALRELPGSAEFRGDFVRTVVEMLLAFAGGVVAGGLLGFAFWRAPVLGRAFEPYLVALYAVPLVVFYPVLLVSIGINMWPIVILATIMATVPMALNTWAGFQGIPRVYLRLAESLRCTPPQRLFQIAVPAAAPLVFAGIRLAAVYALIGVIAMEFVVAGKGLGFRIRYLYELFNQPGMFAYILVVFLLAVVFTGIVTAAERRVSAHRQVVRQ